METKLKSLTDDYNKEKKEIAQHTVQLLQQKNFEKETKAHFVLYNDHKGLVDKKFTAMSDRIDQTKL